MPLKTASRTSIFGCKFTGGQILVVILNWKKVRTMHGKTGINPVKYVLDLSTTGVIL